MNIIHQQLDKKYKAINKTFADELFHDFYDSIFHYADYIEKQPTLRSIVEYDRNDMFEKMQQIDPTLSKYERNIVVKKMNRYSLSYHYDRILIDVYTPIKEYRALLHPITPEHARGCALSFEEIGSIFGYLLDIFIASVIGNKKERNYAYFRICYRNQPPCGLCHRVVD